MATETSAAFTIDLSPGEGLLPTTGRFDFVKTWTGGLAGTSRGTMLSAGDPATGTAGYVALEHFTGELDGRSGSLVFQQFGTMTAGEQELRYEIVPGSGTDALAGITGAVALSVVDGDHRVTVTYQL